jgi:putative tricarboxylic transport membrane protein
MNQAPSLPSQDNVSRTSKVDLVVAMCFLAIGLSLAIFSGNFPAGVGPLPGPGFFPRVIGLCMVALAAWLVKQSFAANRQTPFTIENKRTVIGALGLTFLYLFFWGSGLFAVRTAVFVVLLLKLFGQSWKSALLVSVALTLIISLSFQFGLRLTLE